MTEYVTVHVNNKVLLTTYTWPHDGFRPSWAPFWPVYGNGLISRGTVAFGDYFAGLCNHYGIDVVSGYYQTAAPGQPPVGNPLENFVASMWATQNLGNVRLCHMAGLNGFPASAGIIRQQVIDWGSRYMVSPKYARIRTSSGAMLPIILFWGAEYRFNYGAFVNMIYDIRNVLHRIVGPVYIIMTEHVCNDVNAGSEGGKMVMNAVDAVYNHEVGLPWHTCNGPCDMTNVVWSGTMARAQLEQNLASHARAARSLNKYFISGTMPSFDRLLWSRSGPGRGGATQGRVLSTGAEVRALFRTARSFSSPIYARSQFLADGEHIHQDIWTAITSAQEWEEGTTIEPCIVRSAADYGYDRMAAVAEVFRDTVHRVPVHQRPIEPRF